MLVPAPSWAQTAGAPFTFVHMTDAHIGGPNARNIVTEVLNAVKEAKPAFIIDGGDATEMGRVSEYDVYQQLVAQVGAPLYIVPGNHDVRWHDAGKREFITRFGEPYRSFTHENVHFVLLDTSIDAETHGHFELDMLEWLKEDLARVGPETPVLIFFHHPITFRPLAFVDNEQAFYNAVAPSMCGASSPDTDTWTTNGTPTTSRTS